MLQALLLANEDDEAGVSLLYNHNGVTCYIRVGHIVTLVEDDEVLSCEFQAHYLSTCALQEVKMEPLGEGRVIGFTDEVSRGVKSNETLATVKFKSKTLRTSPRMLVKVLFLFQCPHLI